MTATARSFNPAAVQLFLHPYRLTGFKGDTFGTLAPVTPDDEHEISTDGVSVTVNVSTDGRYILTVSMDPEGLGYKRLGEIRKEQRDAIKAGGAIPARAFRYYDPSNGDEVTSEHAIIISRPAIGMGKARDAVEFRILLPSPVVKLGEDL